MKDYAHLIGEGIKHFTGSKELGILETKRMAVMLENAEETLALQHGMDRHAFREAQTSTGSMSTFVKTQLPIIRRVYPNMISRELVSVQPMTQPTTKLFYYDIKRDDATSLADGIHDKRTYANNVEYNPDSATAIKEINLTLTDSDVSATEKKLKAKWTVEAQQDIMNYHGINVENDLTGALATEITREWDRQNLQSLLDGATGGAATFNLTVPDSLTYQDRKYWMETLYEKFIDVDTQIFKKRYRKTNWILVPADIAGFIEKMAGFRSDGANPEQQVIQTGGRYFMGSLNSRWRCYCDPFFPSNKILMGYNGTGDWLDTAAVFAPYILAYFSDTFTDPNTFQKVRAILSRAAFKVVVGDLLGVITTVGS